MSDKAGEQLELLVPQRGIWGTASIGGANIDTYAPWLLYPSFQSRLFEHLTSPQGWHGSASPREGYLGAGEARVVVVRDA